MESIIFDKSIGDKTLENRPFRFDMAINFYAVVKKDNEYKLVAYYYSPAWNLYYPFYDDVNKTPIICESKSETFGELINETDEILNINKNENIELAVNRFKELIGCGCSIKESLNKHIFYELKYSKTSNILFTNYLTT